MKWVLAVAGLLLAVLGMDGSVAADLPGLTISDGFGVNIHFRHDPPDLDMIAEAGFRFIRMDLGWEGVEREKGVYDFERTGYDALTAGCVRRGIRILYIIDYSNRLYESERSVRTAEGRRAYAAFAQAAATRYAGKGILWEIWNEPNIKQFWTPEPNVEDYCAMAMEAIPLIRKADPSGVVVAPATSGVPHGWIEECFKKGLLAQLDAVSVHPYRPQNPETVVADYEKLRKLIKQYSPDRRVPIISGEWGYSNVNWDRKPLSPETQAQYLAREYLTNLWQDIPVSIWYDWKNDGTDPTEREHNFGTVMHDLKPKPAYTAARTLNTTLAGFTFDKRIETDSADDFVLQFIRDGRQALTLWTTGDDHEITLTLPPGRAALVDMQGERSRIQWTEPGPKITLTQSPQYLLIRPTR